MDTSLFFFINSSLQNGFLDIVMPFVTERGYLLFLLIVLFTFFRDRKKTLIVLLLTLLAFVFSDANANVLKHLFQRQRPCHELENVRLLAGCGGSFSFPSAHAMNAFAIAATFSHFFRKTAFFTFPLAFLVAFSRVYLGVHYPSDVLAGAVAGGAVAWITISLKEWFSESFSEKPAQTIFFTVTIVLAFFRYYYIITGPLDLSPDEAHYWEWSRRLDLSYYSKGPLIAWLIAGTTWLMGNSILAVRSLAPLFLALSSLLVYRLTLDIFPEDKNAHNKACAAGLMLQLVPLFAAYGVVFTIDSPFIFFWTLSLYLFRKATNCNGLSVTGNELNKKSCHSSLVTRHSLTSWLLLGISVGLGLLTKYTMAFFYLCATLFLFFTKEERIWFKRKEPYIAFAVSLLVFSPVIIWNAGHEWVTFRHTAGQAHISEGLRISFRDFFEFIGSQVGVISPLLFFMVIYGAIKESVSADRSRVTRHASRFLFWFWSPVLVFFLLKSLQAKVQANWAMFAYITAFIASSDYFLSKEKLNKGLKTLMICTLSVLMLFAVITHYPSIISLPVKQDPTSRLMGWEELGKKADAVYADMRHGKKEIFIFSDKYQVSSELAFYMKGHPVTYNINLGRRMNQYDLWDGFEDLLGFDALFVRMGNERFPDELEGSFDSFSKELFTVHRRDGKVLREYSIFKCYNFKGFNNRGFKSY
jgi:undecaprenyl-diphosphatase